MSIAIDKIKIRAYCIGSLINYERRRLANAYRGCRYRNNWVFPKGHIVEIGLASLETKTGEVKKVFESVCHEDGMTAKDRNAWIFKNSNLTVDAVRKSPMLNDLKPEIQKAFNSFDAVTAYNKSFDFTFLRDRGFEIESEWPCPMKVATNVCKLPGKRRGGASYKWPKVQEAWDFFFPNEPYVEAHRGCDDAIHEALIVYELCLLGKMPTLNVEENEKDV